MTRPGGPQATSRKTKARLIEEIDSLQRRLDGILEIEDDAIVGVDETLRVTFFNTGAEKVFGYAAEEVLGQELDRLLPERFHAAHGGHIESFGRSKETARRMDARAEIVGRRKNGEEFPAEAAISKLRADGATSYTVILRDITERRQREKEISVTRARLESIADNIPGNLFRRVLHPDGSITYPYLSAGSLKHFGVDPVKGLEDPEYVLGTIHPDDRARVEKAIQLSAKTLDTYECEFRLVSGAGDEKWVQSKAHPRRLDNGDVVWDGVTIDVTEARLAKDARQRSQAEAAAARQQLLDAVESISDGFVLYDSDERLVLCNSKYRELYPGVADILVPGAKLSDVVQAAMDRREIVLSDVTPAQWIEARLKQYRSGQGSHEQNTADGRWILARETRSADGGFVGTRTDITGQKLREAALAESEARFRAITETSPAAILISRVSDGQILFCNPQFAELVGLPIEQVLGRRTVDLYHDPEDRERVLSEFKDGRARNVEMQTKRADGEPRWTMFSAQQMEFGGEQALLSVIVDITERKEAEAALGEVEERFRAVVDNQPNSIVFKDLQGVIRIANKCWEEWFGIPVEKALGKTAHDVFEKNIADDLEEQDRRVLDGRRVIDREYLTPFADGELHTLVVTKFPVFAGDGKTIGVVAISIDVTQQRRIETELSQIQKMEAIGHLTGGVAHDFNNLLTVILGHLELLAEDLSDRPEELDLIRPARNAARRGAELTQRLLAFSRKQALQPQLTDLDRLVSGLTDLLRRSLGEAIEIRTVTTGQPWKTMVDPGQVENALLNLAINARDAMPEGGRLDIHTANVTLEESSSDAPAGEYVSLAVSDTGIGMSPEIAQRAFEPFFTTKEVGKGTGLGLSMIYGFVKQSGGYARIASREGEGSTVTLFFPRADVAETADAGGPDGAADIPSGTETILLVEDDGDIRYLATRALTGLGYTVVAAADGRDALRLLDETARVDMLLTDIVLPGGMSGRDVAEEVIKRRPDIKTLFVSGYAEEVLAPQGVLSEGITLLKKPFTMSSLARFVRDVLDQQTGST